MRSLIAAVLFASALSLFAQEKIVETIEVRVANIDVVVTDRAGNPVSGLTKDDFELFENGKPQAITNFYEIRPGSEAVVISTGTTTSTPPATPAPKAAAVVAPEDVRARRFVFFVDNYSMQPAQRNGTLAALRRFLDTNMKASDEASLVVWAHNLDIVTPLTNDKAALLRGIDLVSQRTRAGMSAADEEEKTRRDCTQIISEVDGQFMTWDQAWIHCEGGVKAYSESVRENERALLKDLTSIVARLAGIDGRKVLIMAGAHLPEHPGRDTMLWAAQQFEQHLP